MQVISPNPHLVLFAQDVLYRGADFSIVWPEILATASIGAVYFGFALHCFRSVIFSGLTAAASAAVFSFRQPAEDGLAHRDQI